MTLNEFYHKYSSRDCWRDMYGWYSYHLDEKMREYLLFLDQNKNELPEWLLNENRNFTLYAFLASFFFSFCGIDFYGASLKVCEFHLLDRDHRVITFNCLEANMSLDINGKKEELAVYSKYTFDPNLNLAIPKYANDIILNVSVRQDGLLFSPLFSGIKHYGDLNRLTGKRIDWDNMERISSEYLFEREAWENRRDKSCDYNIEALNADAFGEDYESYDNPYGCSWLDIM